MNTTWFESPSNTLLSHAGSSICSFDAQTSCLGAGWWFVTLAIDQFQFQSMKPTMWFNDWKQAIKAPMIYKFIQTPIYFQFPQNSTVNHWTPGLFRLQASCHSSKPGLKHQVIQRVDDFHTAPTLHNKQCNKKKLWVEPPIIINAHQLSKHHREWTLAKLCQEDLFITANINNQRIVNDHC